MKSLVLALIFVAFNASAQTANIKDIPVDGETNISITKGAQNKPVVKTWEIVDEKTDIAGEPESLTKEARASWKKACAEWKADTKELNKENKVIHMNCGQPTCEKTESVTTTCKSVATYKVKVKVE